MSEYPSDAQPDHTADEQAPDAPTPLVPRMVEEKPAEAAPAAPPDPHEDFMGWLKYEMSEEGHKVAAALENDRDLLLQHLEKHLPPASLAIAQKVLGAEL
jgi:hypothetical protein